MHIILGYFIKDTALLCLQLYLLLPQTMRKRLNQMDHPSIVFCINQANLCGIITIAHSCQWAKIHIVVMAQQHHHLHTPLILGG